MPNNKTNPKAKQRRTRFIKEFLKDRNASRAAVAAGFSEKGSGVRGHRLLQEPEIREAIDREEAKYHADLSVSVDRVRRELARLAFFDPRSFFSADGSLKPLSQLTDDEAAVIAGLDLTELFAGNGDQRNNIGVMKKLKLANKLDALEQLGRHLKMFTDKIEVSTDADLTRALLSGRKRAQERNRAKGRDSGVSG